MEISKDIYETDDLPEADQDYDEDVKDCVETLDISVLKAYNKFKGKEILINEKTRREKLRKDHYNPIDRANRIIAELQSLSASLKVDKDTDNEAVSKEQLILLSDSLVTQVQELDLEKYFGPESVIEIKDPKNITYNQLIKKMDGFEIKSSTDTNEDKKKSYALMRQTNVNEYLAKVKISNLVKRVEVLEKVMGDNNVKLANIVSDCSSKGLLEAVDKLSAKTSLLNPSQLTIVESRLNGVVNKLQGMTSVNSISSNLEPESQLKISELYELVKKHDPVMDTIPNVVDQCVSMQEFHAKGAQLSHGLCHLEVKQGEVCSKQQISEMVLKNIQENMPRNFETMEKNMKLLEERMKIIVQ